MCKICALVLKKLHTKGLISTGNINMCLDELEKEAAKAIANAEEAAKSLNSVEFDMIMRHQPNKNGGGYDA